MSHLRYSAYPGFGEEAARASHYSQAVRLPPGETIQTSGQGGWDRTTSKISLDLADEIDQAFNNVHNTLVTEGGHGISQVYKLVVYLTPMSDEALTLLVENLRKWFPSHQPLLTVIGVENLALPGMRIEVEASAHVG